MLRIQVPRHSLPQAHVMLGALERHRMLSTTQLRLYDESCLIFLPVREVT